MKRGDCVKVIDPVDAVVRFRFSPHTGASFTVYDCATSFDLALSMCDTTRQRRVVRGREVFTDEYQLVERLRACDLDVGFTVISGSPVLVIADTHAIELAREHIIRATRYRLNSRIPRY